MGNSFGECAKERDMNEFRNVRVRVKNGMYFFSKKESPVATISWRNEDEKILYDTQKVATQCAESVLLFMEENEERKSPNIRKSSFYQELVRGIDDPVLNGNDQDVWTSFDKPTEVVAVSSSSEGEEEAKNEEVQIQNKIIGPKRKKGQSAKRVRTDSGVFCS